MSVILTRQMEESIMNRALDQANSPDLCFLLRSGLFRISNAVIFGLPGHKPISRPLFRTLTCGALQARDMGNTIP